MNATVFGSGYASLGTGACLADAGNNVLCIDVNADRGERLRQGELPINEPGHKDLIRRAPEFGHVNFTTGASHAVTYAEIQVITVGALPAEDSFADVQNVLAVARTICEVNSSEPSVMTRYILSSSICNYAEPLYRRSNNLPCRGMMLS